MVEERVAIAGTGTDTRPNRILSPLRQAEKLDPHGDYVRRYVPELSDIPGGAIHTPWLLPLSARPKNYPERIIELDGALTRLRERRGLVDEH
jgi:deoxyribodipyrimidine photo-lyase